jgi:hypothetical protein
MTARPRLEALEDRIVPSLINHGGAILPSVEAQALYLGSNWSASSIPTSTFDNFLATTVNGTTDAPAPYLAMLKNAGFTGVTGAGSSLPGVTDNLTLSGRITDADIQAELAADIQNTPGMQQPDSNTLYVVFVQPDTVVDLGAGQDSTNTFLAYHSSFIANGSLIRYTVVPFHGTAGNAQAPWLNSALDSMTMAASHETAEAITDPDGQTWFDRSGNEIGDSVSGVTVYLNGYAVQREAAIPGSVFNFLAMTPAGAAASHAVTYSIAGGALNVTEGDGSSFIAANPSGETGQVVSVSAQGIDDFGQPMADVLFSDGNAYEYHDFAAPTVTSTGNPSFFPWTSLGGNVEQAVAGQGVSYVLFNNGNLGEYVDPNYTTFFFGYGVNPGSRTGVIASNVSAIVAAGTDQVGVNAVEFTVRGSATVREWRDVTGQSSTNTASFQPAGSASLMVGGVLAPQVAGQSSAMSTPTPSAAGSTTRPSNTSSLGFVALSIATPAPMVSNAVFQTPGPAALESPRQAQVVTAAVVRPDLGGGGDPDDAGESQTDPDDGGESQTDPDDGAELVQLWFGDVDM